jgi:hypothetical protein
VRIGAAGHGEEQVADAVDINRRAIAHRFTVAEGDHQPLGAAADRAGQVQGGTGGRAAGQYERAQRRQLLLGLVDPALHLLDALPGQLRQLGLAAALPRLRRGQVRADGEQVRLDGCEVAPDRHVADGLDGPAQHRVQLIDLAIRFDARVILRHATTAEQSRVTEIARARVNFHGRAITSRPLWPRFSFAVAA